MQTILDLIQKYHTTSKKKSSNICSTMVMQNRSDSAFIATFVMTATFRKNFKGVHMIMLWSEQNFTTHDAFVQADRSFVDFLKVKTHLLR